MKQCHGEGPGLLRPIGLAVLAGLGLAVPCIGQGAGAASLGSFTIQNQVSSTGATVTPTVLASASPDHSKKSSTQNATVDTVTIAGSHFAANSGLTATVSAGRVTTGPSTSTDSSGNIPSATTFVMNNPTTAQTITVTVTDASGNSGQATFAVTNN